ncbi:hypothetical protein [Blastococcus sp. SYSU DS0617]
MTFLRLGLAGQVLTFAAMVVPILGRVTDQVLVLVFASSVALLLVNAGMLAFPFVYPVVRGPRLARVATVWSLVVLYCVSAAVAALSPLDGRLGLPAGTFASAAAVTAAWGTFSVMNTRLVRVGDDTGIGLARLYYGALVLTTAVAATVADPGPLALTLGQALSYLLAAALLLGRRTHHGPPLRRSTRAGRRRLRRAWFARVAQPTAASLAGGWTAVIPGLVVPGLGTAAEPWAVVSRICGGFATVMIALIAPPLEARLGRAVRDRDRAAWDTGRRTALALGLGLAGCGVVGGLALALYAADDAAEWFAPVAVATVLFWGSLLAGTLLNRLPNFLGRDGQRLWWDLGRAAAVTAAFLLVDGQEGLVAMGVVLAASAWFLLPMTRWNRRER